MDTTLTAHRDLFALWCFLLSIPPPAILEISIELPEGHSPDAVAYRLVRDGKEWTAENYTYRNGENYTLYLPDLQKDERVEFSLGWEGAAFAQYDVTVYRNFDVSLEKGLLILRHSAPPIAPKNVVPMLR